MDLDSFLECAACGLALPKNSYSGSQRKKKTERRCSYCVASDHPQPTPAPAPAPPLGQPEGKPEVLDFHQFVPDSIDPAEVVRRLRATAQQGPEVGLFALAEIFYRGEQVPADRGNRAVAAWLYQRAADEGDLEALWTVGSLHLGDGGVVEPNHEEALKHFHAAAAKGHGKSHASIGGAYRSGKGVERDLAAAARWLQSALDLGDAGADMNLYFLAQWDFCPGTEVELVGLANAAHLNGRSGVASLSPTKLGLGRVSVMVHGEANATSIHMKNLKVTRAAARFDPPGHDRADPNLAKPTSRQTVSHRALKSMVSRLGCPLRESHGCPGTCSLNLRVGASADGSLQFDSECYQCSTPKQKIMTGTFVPTTAPPSLYTTVL